MNELCRSRRSERFGANSRFPKTKPEPSRAGPERGPRRARRKRAARGEEAQRRE